MPHAKINDANLYYEIHGQGEETLLFFHGLLWSGKMFHKQIAHFSKQFRCITVDHRGQGQSEITDSGYHMDDLYRDAVAWFEHFKIESCHVVGLSMGGFVGMRLATRNPELVRSLILMETSADKEPSKTKYKLLSMIVNVFGVSSVTGPVMKVMFGKKFLKDKSRKEELNKWIHELQQNQKSITRAVRGVIDRPPILLELEKIKAPVLILVGDQDVATVPSKAYQMADLIPHSRVELIKGAGHTSSIEEPEQVNHHIQQFLDEVLILNED